MWFRLSRVRVPSFTPFFSKMEQLFESLSIVPKDKKLYYEALTHPSANKSRNYERLEYLSDAVIELIATEYIYTKFPKYPEGKMTKLRALVVSRPSLAKFASMLKLTDYMKFSEGELRNKGREKDRTQCNAFEATLGAIYLDQGFAKAEQIFLSCAKAMLDEGYVQETGIDNPKGKLQEILQAIVPVAPLYELLSEKGPDHNKVFTVRVIWQETELGQGQGSSKKAAESAAALSAVQNESWKSISQ